MILSNPSGSSKAVRLNQNDVGAGVATENENEKVNAIQSAAGCGREAAMGNEKQGDGEVRGTDADGNYGRPATCHGVADFYSCCGDYNPFHLGMGALAEGAFCPYA